MPYIGRERKRKRTDSVSRELGGFSSFVLRIFSHDLLDRAPRRSIRQLTEPQNLPNNVSESHTSHRSTAVLMALKLRKGRSGGCKGINGGAAVVSWPWLIVTFSIPHEHEEIEAAVAAAAVAAAVVAAPTYFPLRLVLNARSGG